MKLKIQHRYLAIEEKSVDEETRTMTFPFSSETPVDRWFGTEILSHDKGAANLKRLNDSAPLLFNHNLDEVIGVVESALINKDEKRGYATVRFAKTAKADEYLGLVRDGIIKNVSFAYRVLAADEDPKTNEYRVTSWEPLEVSIVSVPADQSVGIGRAFGDDEKEVRIHRINDEPANTAEPERVKVMDGSQNAPAGPIAEPQISALEAEKERRAAIQNLCKGNKIDSRVEAQWIERGTPLTVVAKEILDVLEERGKSQPSVVAQVGLSSKETKNYSLFRAIRALRFGAANPKFVQEAAFEYECARAIAKNLGRELTTSILIPSEVLARPLGAEAASRAMSTSPGSKGGYMVNVDNMGFIDILRNRSVAMAMGARVLGGLQGNVTFPRQTGKPTVTWQAGEGISVTAADQTIGQLSMTPKTCIAITDVSEQLLAQASPSAEAFVMADLAADVAIDGVDNATINGLGGAQPLGIKNTTGVTTGQDASSATYSKILAFIQTAGAANAILGNPGFVTNTAGAIRLLQVQRFTSTDTPLWVGNVLNGQCVGFNAMSSEQLAAANLIFGSWDQVIIGEWGVLELSTDNGGTRFNQAQVGIRAMWMVDVLLRYPQAFVVSTNLS